MSDPEPTGTLTQNEVYAQLLKLREPFPANQVGKLPKPYKKDSERGKCQECGGYHGLPAMHLDFVGHAALTDRFLDVDPEWSWRPMGVDQNGLPVLDGNGGLWIWLTILGVTRPGYGDADSKRGGNAVKEAIGDALRNAGMRFGAALDLWHKGDLHEVEEAKGTEPSDADKALPNYLCPPTCGRAQVVGEGLAGCGHAAGDRWAPSVIVSGHASNRRLAPPLTDRFCSRPSLLWRPFACPDDERTVIDDD